MIFSVVLTKLADHLKQSSVFYHLILFQIYISENKSHIKKALGFYLFKDGPMVADCFDLVFEEIAEASWKIGHKFKQLDIGKDLILLKLAAQIRVGLNYLIFLGV